MKRIAGLITVLLIIGCVQMYAQQGRTAPSPQQPALAEAPELASLPPEEGEMDMLMPESEDVPPQGFEEAGAPRQMREHDEVAMLPKILGKLKLTDVQKKDVDKIVFDEAKQVIAQRAKVETARLELRQLFNEDNPDKNTIEKKIDEVANLSAQIHINLVDGWFAINKLLTPDQQKIWKHALAARPQMEHEKCAGHFGEGGQHPQVHPHHFEGTLPTLPQAPPQQ